MSQPSFSYPEAFAARVRQEFPEDKELSALLTAGSKFHVGYTLLQNGKTELYAEWNQIMAGCSKKTINPTAV